MDPVALQKQIKDNSEDLTRFLGDLNSWQEDIKQKEKELEKSRNDNKNQIPPVRSKKNKGKTAINSDEVEPSPSEAPKVPEEKSTPNGQASGSEFISYDFAKATSAYNDERGGKPLADTISDAEKQKRLEEANYEKENGNTNVKNKKWKEAIGCYTRAIAYDATNPIFFANRALCYLKIEKFEGAVEDCSKALELDSNYVKAYLRRGSAFTSLNEPELAIKDLTMAVKLEPANKEARKCLLEAKTLKTKLDASDNSMVVAISKAHHERSKAPLKRISITEVGSCTEPLVKKKETETSESKERPSSLELNKPNTPCSSSRTTTPRSIPRTPITPLSTTPVYLTEIPEAPINSVQLTLTWSQLRPEDRYKYISKIPGSSLPQVFGDSMESEIFTDVLRALKLAEEDDPIAEYLFGLSETKRFGTLSLFMSSSDRSTVLELIRRSLEAQHITEKEAADLKSRFGV
ncbi:RNA polymerase II-associated protein 3 [Neocloeon triangulifer]|uniref:RNA polymerase II-associated protein 3 n=1 Tax=Neocloeon triangulifer TaxID=2078957 RepID=UPI00286EC1F6|nr:RNA polymerase II-associated protein 3 [Neocloeon triangulifer]